MKAKKAASFETAFYIRFKMDVLRFRKSKIVSCKSNYFPFWAS